MRLFLITVLFAGASVSLASEPQAENCGQRWQEFKGGFSYTACTIDDIIADRAALDPDDPRYWQKWDMLKRMLQSYRGNVVLPVTIDVPEPCD